ncbi:SusC/RagA family TonB-linked outer membrane protein [Sphingobacterium detergens]|uniref:TonB-linked SusC/RagA family outer membrane protein n=1 Tax=Sphingobacterium detergens TaxID=1145106 RepID=A0A420B6K1_SPHD1|nr:TonB-dependent receptor [Sphingobacterium detergens]RKE52289.1 TonB-linked SusC/RagA family outer membrane protein [Sphingobacterium detergens]
MIKTIRKIVGCMLLLFSLCFQAFAQTHTVSGAVSNEQGAPIPGASVSIKNSANPAGTKTDEKGTFTLKTAPTDTLLVSFVGYDMATVAIAGKSNIRIVLKQSNNVIEDVVVIGYGSRRKTDLTGAVGSVKGDVLQERPSSSLNQALSGRISGVNVSSNSGRPGGRANIRIRGISSISVSNNPLYVVDGVILNTTGMANGSSPIDYINPNEIESIDVLKDASSTAIYGARGANGVILVTTKRGTAGGGKVNYEPYFSVGVAPKKLPVLNSAEFLRVEEEIYKNAQKYDPVGWANGDKYTDPRTKRTDPRLFDKNGNPLYDTDWQDVMFKKAFTQNHQLGFTNGNEQGNYGIFLNYRNENGIIYGSSQKRYSGRFTAESNIKSWLKVGGNLSYTDQTEKQVDELNGGGIVTMRQVLEAIPIIPVRYPDGTWAANKDYPGMEGGDNPVRVADDRLYYLRTQTMLGNVFATFKLAEGLELRSVLGTNIINQRTDYFAAKGMKYISDNGNASVTNDRYNSWQFENYLTYNKTFADIHAINVMAGLSWQHVDYFGSVANSEGYVDDFFKYNNLGAAATALQPGSSANAYGLNSYFARINYTLKDRYLLTLTGRTDGSSKFGKNNRYAFFPSAALAWKVNEEEFLKDHAFISNLKVRTSIGYTGNSEIPAYRAEPGMNNYGVIFSGARVNGVGVGTIANPDLKWEKTQQIDFGLELGLFQNRIAVELDLYRRKVDNMLLNATIPYTSGYRSVFTNIGSMENKGIEFSLNTVNVKNENFTWSTNFNISVNKNKVLALAGGSDLYAGNTVIRVGEPIGAFFGRIAEGTYGTGEAELAKKYGRLPGDIKYRDLNGDDVINDNDRTIIGYGTPKGYGSFINTFTYKDWSLSVDLQYMYGNDVLDRSLHSLEDRQGMANSYKTVLNAWTETNQNTAIAQVRPNNAYYDTFNDSHKITDASFIRGRNLLLSYNLPKDLVNRWKLERVRFYGSVQNFFVATKYKGYDPEVSNSSSPLEQGFALYDYPRPRTFMLGLNVTF